MNHSNYWISLDINKILSQLTLTLKHGETGRAIHIRLTEDGRPYQISDGCSATLEALKADSTNPISQSCTIQDNMITVYVEPALTSTVGRVECEVVLRGKDSQMIVTPSFSIVVYNNIYSKIEEEHESDKNSLLDVISEGTSLISEIEKMRDDGEFNAGFASEMNVTTTTGEAGSKASVEVTPDDSTPNGAKKFNFDFTIPRGDKGEQGEKGDQGKQGEKGDTGERGDPSTVRIGTVTTGKPNTAAKVTNSGTEKDAVLNFTLPIGEQAVRILTKAEFDALETKEDGIIYVFSDDDTWETSYKYDKTNADFSTVDKLFHAPAGCYTSQNVYGLVGGYTLLVCGNANTIGQAFVSNGLEKTILAMHGTNGKVYISHIDVSGSDVLWTCLNNPVKQTFNYGQSVDGVITITNLSDSNKTYVLNVTCYSTVNGESIITVLPPFMVRSRKNNAPSIGGVAYYQGSNPFIYSFELVESNTASGIYKYKLNSHLLLNNSVAPITRYSVEAKEI